MEEVEVYVVEAEFAEAGLEAFANFVRADIAVPYFGGDEEFFAWEAALSDGLADGFFVVVECGGVDGSVALLDGEATAVDALLWLFNLKNAKSEPGHGDLVVERDP